MEKPKWGVIITAVAAAVVWSCGPTGVRPDPPGPEIVDEPAQVPPDDEGPRDDPDAGLAPDAGWMLPDAGGDPVTDAGTPTPEDGCAEIFQQSNLPTYEVEIAADEWAKLEDEFLHRKEREAAGLDVHPWHPIVFRYKGQSFPSAMIRLKGQSSWRLAVEKDPNPKMQFVISFNEVSKKGRFMGLRKLVLDMPRNDRTFLRQRLALSYLRDHGLPVQCANNARLVINGAYYGLFANMEHLDKEFIQRVFPQADEGDLWKGGYELKTNETTSDWHRRDALYGATTVQQVEALADLPAALDTWAAEAMMPNGDGYYAGTYNYFLYDHPDRGFVWLAYDLDGTWDHIPYDVDPITWKFAPQKQLHWSIVLSDPEWEARYVDALEAAWASYDTTALEKRLDEWSAQIQQAANDDPHRPFSMSAHEADVVRLKTFFAARKAFVREWIDAWRANTE